jgi:hypothetical protein
MNYKNKYISFMLLFAALISVGCSAGKSTSWLSAKNWDIRRAVGLKSNQPLPPQIPDRMVTSWVNTVLNKPGIKSQRGFGGRIAFFGKEGDMPVRVDGQLVVYAFDESLGDPDIIQPTRRYVFPKEQFVLHESETKLGPSYSVWLPWDAVGGEQKGISLIARFEPHGGALLVGEQTRHLLPGTNLASKKPVHDEPQATSGVQLAQHTKPQGTATTATHEVEEKTARRSSKKMTSTTIPLSKSWRKRLANQSAPAIIGFNGNSVTALNLFD